MTALPHDLLAQLEAEQAGELSAEDTQKLQDRLAEIPGGPEAAADYRRLWAGFDALAREEQRTKMAAWEQDWQATDDTELIEWYEQGELSPANRTHLEERLRNDEALAAKQKEQKDLMAGLEALAGQQFREKMEGWNLTSSTDDKPEVKVRSLRSNWRRFAQVAAAIILLMTVGTYWNARQSYSDEALAAKYYKLPPTGNTMSGGEVLEEATYLDDFTEAHAAMQQKDYERARLLFESLITQVPPANFTDDDVKYYQDNLDWNLVLALLGSEESGRPLEQRLDVILASPDHTYYPEALRLKNDLEKFWR